MLEFATVQNQIKRSRARIILSWVASCFLHLVLLGLLIRFPQLLQGGRYHHFPLLGTINDLLAPASKEDDREWRTVAILKAPPMTAPSAELLKKLIYDWEKSKSASPPVKVRWGDEQKLARETSAPVPRTRKESQSLPSTIAAADEPSALRPADFPEPPAAKGPLPTVTPGIAQADAQGKRGIFLPPPGQEARPKTETAESRISGAAASARGEMANPQAKISGKETSARIFENEQQALSSPEGGLFDTKGFPLGEYANLIIERIKERWFIPSNLRNARGHTTIIFFINKDGQSTDARIVSSSGIASLDLAALNAIMLANPFPPLPKGFPGEQVGAKFIFSYNEPQ